MESLTERKWCAWTNRCTGRDSSIARRHDTVDGRLAVVAVEAATLDIWTQWTEIVPFFEVMVRRHGLVSNATRCRRLQTKIAEEG
jgi:hypothetical protein